jgi:hypothetical protein
MSIRLRNLLPVRRTPNESESAISLPLQARALRERREGDQARRGHAPTSSARLACTRCFGCRFELEELLQAHYGDRYHHESSIHIPDGYEKAAIPNPMYMPVLAGFRGYEVDTRMIVFNWEGPQRRSASAST